MYIQSKTQISTWRANVLLYKSYHLEIMLTILIDSGYYNTSPILLYYNQFNSYVAQDQ